jgi:glycosyltransferase involved in cell wall biosynthesis
MSSNPLFSIVMPTRNRANLLPNALRSAMEQTYDDYEIIVSDNNSTPETEQAVRRVGDGRVRYVRSDQTLSMKDSWEFAITHAKGDYITILSDDDAISPTLLERLTEYLADRPVKLVSWIRYLYIMRDWYVESDRNKLFLSPVTGRAEERQSEPVLRQWFAGCTYYADAPMLFNACCHRSIIDRVKAKAGRFFLGTAPDVAASLALLSAVPSFTFIDDVLSLAGSGRQSIGANTVHAGGNPVQEFVSELKDDAYPRGPFKTTLLTTVVADTMINVKEALPDRLAGYEINWSNYFIGCYKDLLSFEKNGADVSGARKQLWKLILRQPPAVKQDFLNFVMSQGRAGALDVSKERLHLWRLFMDQPLGVKRQFLRFTAGSYRRQIKSRLGRNGAAAGTAAPNPYIVSGDEAGFTNILECARALDSLVARVKRGELPAASSA